MFKRIPRPREEIPRPRHGISRPRPRHLGKKIPQQFLQINADDEFEMILVQSPKPRPAKKPVQAPVDSLRFVFQPMATSTPRRKTKPSEPPKTVDMPQVIDDPEPEENHRLGPRLTMSQFIGAPPNKHKEHDQTMITPSPSRVVKLPNYLREGSNEFQEEIAVKLPNYLREGSNEFQEDIAVKLPNYLREGSNDFQTIIVDDFTDGVDLNKTQDLLRVIYGEDYPPFSTEELDELDLDLLSGRKPMTDSPFTINDSTRCIFKEMLRDAHPRKGDFEIPTPREFYRSRPRVRKPSRSKKAFPNFLSEEPRPKQRRVLKGLQLRRELRDLYEFLKLLFETDDTAGDLF